MHLADELTPSTRLPATQATPALVLVFGFGGHLAAETFEALVCMALFSRQQGTPSSVPLASVYDAAHPVRLAEFLRAMQALVGPLEGTPRSAEAPSDPDSASKALLTPLRGLAIAEGAPNSAPRPTRR